MFTSERRQYTQRRTASLKSFCAANYQYERVIGTSIRRVFTARRSDDMPEQNLISEMDIETSRDYFIGHHSR